MSANDFRILDEDTQFMDKYPNGLTLTDLLPFYDTIARNEPLKLEWVCPGKIDPNAQREKNTIRTEASDIPNPKVSESLSSSVKLKEFDFDEYVNQLSNPSIPLGTTAQNTNLPLRRLVGTSRHPPRQPRVTSMDKILSDFFKSRKEPSPAVSSEVMTTSVAAVTVQHSVSSTEFSQTTRISTEISKNNSEEDKQEALAATLAKTSMSPQVVHINPDNMSSDLGSLNDNTNNLPPASTDHGVLSSSTSVLNISDGTKMEFTTIEEVDNYVNSTNPSDFCNN
ncbi:unnamed protein product, partial [Heterobilharzia americana]